MLEVTVVELKQHDSPLAVVPTAMTAVDASDSHYVATTDVYGAKFKMDYKAGRYVTYLTNESTTTDATVHARGGTSRFAVDEDVSVPKSSTVAVIIDGGKHKCLSGDDKGYVFITGPSALKIAVVRTADNF